MEFVRSLLCLAVLLALLGTTCAELTLAGTAEYTLGHAMVQRKENPLTTSAINRLLDETGEEASVHPEKLQFVELADLADIPVYLSGHHSRSIPALARGEYFCVNRLLLYKLFKVFII